jgi:hypothetical protein
MLVGARALARAEHNKKAARSEPESSRSKRASKEQADEDEWVESDRARY